MTLWTHIYVFSFLLDKELDLIEETRKATAYADDITDDDDTAIVTTNEYFECTVAVTAGSMEIEIPSAKDVLTCDRSPTHPLGEAVFEIIGEESVLETFFQDVDLTRADVTLNVSSNIVNHKGQIDINQHTLDQVYITFAGENRRRELSGTGVDTRNVLVIRVSDDRNRISSSAKVSQTANKLRDDFFAWDNNNLVRFQFCTLYFLFRFIPLILISYFDREPFTTDAPINN